MLFDRKLEQKRRDRLAREGIVYSFFCIDGLTQLLGEHVHRDGLTKAQADRHFDAAVAHARAVVVTSRLPHHAAATRRPTPRWHRAWLPPNGWHAEALDMFVRQRHAKLPDLSRAMAAGAVPPERQWPLQLLARLTADPEDHDGQESYADDDEEEEAMHYGADDDASGAADIYGESSRRRRSVLEADARRTYDRYQGGRRVVALGDLRHVGLEQLHGQSRDDGGGGSGGNDDDDLSADDEPMDEPSQWPSRRAPPRSERSQSQSYRSGGGGAGGSSVSGRSSGYGGGGYRGGGGSVPRSCRHDAKSVCSAPARMAMIYEDRPGHPQTAEEERAVRRAMRDAMRLFPHEKGDTRAELVRAMRQQLATRGHSDGAAAAAARYHSDESASEAGSRGTSSVCSEARSHASLHYSARGKKRGKSGRKGRRK